MNALSTRIKNELTIGDIRTMCRRFDYKYYSAATNNNAINIINVRSRNRDSGKFDDSQIVTHKVGNKLYMEIYDVTVDPSRHYLLNPINAKGTAIVVQGQYLDAWQLGLHRGKYDALVQVRDMLVVRDANRDNMLDIADSYSRLLETSEKLDSKLFKACDDKGNVHVLDLGLFGINCHRASKWKLLDKVGLYGAGCTVHRDPYKYDKFIKILKANSNKNTCFSPIWINEDKLFND